MLITVELVQRQREVLDASLRRAVRRSLGASRRIGARRSHDSVVVDVGRDSRARAAGAGAMRVRRAECHSLD